MNQLLVRGIIFFIVVTFMGSFPVYGMEPRGMALIAVNNLSGVDTVYGSSLATLVEGKFTGDIKKQTNLRFVDRALTIEQLKKSGLESYFDAAPLCTSQDLRKIAIAMKVDQLAILDIYGYAEIKKEKRKKAYQLLLGLRVIGVNGEETNYSGEGFSEGYYDTAFNNSVANLINDYLKLDKGDSNGGNSRAYSSTVVGNKVSKMYHLVDTHHQPKDETKITFASRTEAEQHGHQQCPICFPDYKSFTYADRALEDRLGAEGCGKIEYYYRVEQNPELQHKLEQIAVPLINVSYRKNIDYKFRILDTTEVNAFSSPNGYIYFTKGMMNVLESDSEIGFVIAHEMAHIGKKHAIISYRRAVAAAFFASVLIAAANNNNPTADLFMLVMAQAVLRGYSRDMEYEADAVAIAHLKQAKMDYQSYDMIMGKFIDMRQAKIAAIEKIFSTHPTPEKRIENLNKLLQSYEKLQERITAIGI